MTNSNPTKTDKEIIAELHTEIVRLIDFAELSSDWFWEQDRNLKFIAFSGAGVSRISRHQSDFIGRRRWEMPISPASFNDMQAHKACCERREEFRDFQYCIFNTQGELQRFTISGTPIYTEEGEFDGYRGTGTNITDLYLARKAFKETEQRLSQIVVGSPIASFVIDSEHIITHWNKACEVLTGIPASKAIGTKNCWQGFYDSPRPVLANLVLRGALNQDIEKHYGKKFRPSALIPGAYEAEDFFPNMQGGKWLFFTAAPLVDELGHKTGAIETLQDITRQKEQEKKILHQAHFDSLTDLPNRFLALDRLNLLIEQTKREHKKLAVLFIDLDDFKKINDTLGHAFGDELLIEASNRLRKTIRNSDTIGRLGGDEFIVLIDDLNCERAVQPIAENLLSSFRQTFKVQNRELLLTASIGISIYPNDGTQPDELLRNADSAMYFSKNQGRNAYHFFTEKMNEGIERRLQIEEQMHGALSRDEFVLNYQPVFDVNSGAIVGAEALLRWSSPVLGQLSPDEFIPIAEQSGLIVPIGYFVLQQALEDTQKWITQYSKPFTIAVNLSPLQFRDPKLTQRIKDTLKGLELPGSCLNLEITEGVLLGNQQHIEQAFIDFAALNIQISMDDFGTGYSSLNYLRQYKFSTLKIDRSFIQDFETDPSAPALINATIAMAHALNLSVIAEGVETKTQKKYLLKKDCDFAQGYYYSKPLAKEDFNRLLSCN